MVTEAWEIAFDHPSLAARVFFFISLGTRAAVMIVFLSCEQGTGTQGLWQDWPLVGTLIFRHSVR